MSHFSVLVIGPDVEKQLQPYHEFECTGENDEFVQEEDVTAECLEHGLDYHGLDDKTVRSEADVDRAGAHKYGFAIVGESGALVRAVKRTNPNSRWDWWVIGGRWSGFLKLKAGAQGELGQRGLMGSCAAEGPGRADVALARDVDFAGMRDEAGDDACARWDKARAAIEAAGAPNTWRTWEQCREEDHKGNIEAARDAYHAQPGMLAVKRALDLWDGIDDYLQPRSVFVQAARDRAISTFAVVYRGEWSEKGRMGWFGCSDDKFEQGDWNKLLNDLLDGLPDDTLLTVVDCHI